MKAGDLAAKKAALSKALSTAYLEHQIADLESRVHAINVEGEGGAEGGVDGDDEHDPAETPEDGLRSPGAAAEVDAASDEQQRPAQAQAQAQAESPAPAHAPAPATGGRVAPRFRQLGRIDDSSSDEHDDDYEVHWRAAVVDVSALMWAPQSVRKLLQRGYEVVIPQDAIRTLDMLKKGNSAVAQAARAAARFIEHAARHWAPISADPSIAVQVGTNYKKGRGLRLQSDSEVAPLAGPEMPGMADTPPPKWVASVLGCAAYFTAIARAEEEDEFEPRAAVLIAHPPMNAEVGPPPVDERPDAPPPPQGACHAERAEGYTLSLEAGRFELPLEVLRDEEGDDEPPPGRRRRGNAHAHGHNENHGHGQGQNRRGRGRGRGRGRAEQQPEPDREVKILLRRPDDREAASPHAVASPTAATHPVPMAAAPSSVPANTAGNANANAHQHQQHNDRGRGGRGRGGRGRGRGGNTGGGFTLLQRPGPPLAHHVRDMDAIPTGGGRGRRDPGEWGWRRAYASNDDDPPRAPPRPRPISQPPHGSHGARGSGPGAGSGASMEQPRVVLLQRPR